jgi:hypothetical protein
MILELLELGKFFGARQTPGGPEVQEDKPFGIALTERQSAAGKVLEGKINGLL